MAEETTEQNLGGTLPTSSLLDQHYTMVVKAILDGRVVPFLGAGVNLCDRSEKGLCRKVDSNKLLSTMSSIFRAQTFQHMV